MGKNFSIYLGVAFAYYSMIYKRAIWILFSILMGNILLIMIEGNIIQIVLKLFCFSNILLLWFVDVKELSILLRIFGIQGSVLTVVKVFTLGVLLLTQALII